LSVGDETVLFLEAFAYRVQRARADVAIHHAYREKRQSR
jgi:hypothetical protein